MNVYQRETDELQPVIVVNPVTGEEATPDEVCAVRDGERPSGWAAPLLDEAGKPSVRVFGLGTGEWRVFAKVGGAVLDAGTFRVV